VSGKVRIYAGRQDAAVAEMRAKPTNKIISQLLFGKIPD